MRADLLTLGAVGALALAGARGSRARAFRQQTREHEIATTLLFAWEALDKIVSDLCDDRWRNFYDVEETDDSDADQEEARRSGERMLALVGLRPDDLVLLVDFIKVYAGGRRKGLGREAMFRAEAYAREVGARALLVHAAPLDNEPSPYGFYVKLGFEEFPGSRRCSSYEGYAMVKLLDPWGSRAKRGKASVAVKTATLPSGTVLYCRRDVPAWGVRSWENAEVFDLEPGAPCPDARIGRLPRDAKLVDARSDKTRRGIYLYDPVRTTYEGLTGDVEEEKISLTMLAKAIKKGGFDGVWMTDAEGRDYVVILSANRLPRKQPSLSGVRFVTSMGKAW